MMYVHALSSSRVFLSALVSVTICWAAEFFPRDAAEQMVKLEKSSNKWFCFKFSRDKAIVAGGGDEIKVWDTKTGKLRMSARTGTYHGPDISLSSDGKLITGASNRPRILVWNTESGKQTHSFDSGNAERIVIAVRFRPDGKVLATGNGDDTISLLDISTGSEALLRQNMSHSAAIDFSEDGKLLASGGRDGTVRIWDVAKKTEKACLKGFQGRVNEVVFGGGDRFLASDDVVSNGKNADSSGVIILHRLQDGKEVARFPGASSPTLTEDGRYFCAISDDDRGFSIWNTSTGAKVFQHQAKGQARFRAVEFVSEGKVICVVEDRKELSLMQVSTGLGNK